MTNEASDYRLDLAAVGADRQAAVRQRDELLQLEWPRSKAVGVMLGSKPTGAEARASRERSAGRLLGAWAGRDKGYVHPEFQFVDSGTVNPRVIDLLDAMANNPGLSAAQDKNGWQRVFWLYQPRGRLSKQAMALRRATPEQLLSDPGRFEKLEDAPRTPADVFPHDPQAVIDLAREDALAQTPPDMHEGKSAAADT